MRCESCKFARPNEGQLLCTFRAPASMREVTVSSTWTEAQVRVIQTEVSVAPDDWCHAWKQKEGG